MVTLTDGAFQLEVGFSATAVASVATPGGTD